MTDQPKTARFATDCFHVVLVEPEIPPNTGSIARLCGATNSVLHLVRPLGFSTDDRYLKRAGLDYWRFVKIVYWDNLDQFLTAADEQRLYFVSKKVDSALYLGSLSNGGYSGVRQGDQRIAARDS